MNVPPGDGEEHLDALDAFDPDSPEEILRALNGERHEQRATGPRDPKRPRIHGHVTATIEPQLAMLVEKCAGAWPPPPELVPYLAVRLLAGLEDLPAWSSEVQQAVNGVRAKVAREERKLRRDRDVKEQVQAGRDVLRARMLMRLRSRFSTEDAEKYAEQTELLRDTAMCDAAKAQQRRRKYEVLEAPVKRGPKPTAHLKVRSVADGWKRRAGAPRKHLPPEWLRLEVDVWRDLRARVRPAEPAIDSPDALAEWFAADLERRDARRHRRLRAFLQQEAEPGRHIAGKA
ncbi:MAG: hypothetical protein M3541_00340 [Acidobacteriota bacterium]|nr:hypothetical protein [Acidobacteriota bacterium]